VESNHKHLGLYISTCLRFHQHVNAIIRKVNAALGPLYAIAKYIPRDTLKQIYCTYVRPHFDYGDIIFHGHITATDSLRLERLQNRAARLVTGALFRTPTADLLKDLGWKTLHVRREMICLINLYKIMNPSYHAPSYLTDIVPAIRNQITARCLRNANNISLPTNRLTSFKQSFLPSSIRSWNRLPEHIKANPTVSTFKKALSETRGPEKPPPFYSYGSKESNILHTRLRLGTSFLNAHLFKLSSNLTDSPNCRCRMLTPETVKHFFLYCPLHAQARTELKRIIININPEFIHLTNELKVKTLLHGHDLRGPDALAVAKAVQKFINVTQRFQ